MTNLISIVTPWLTDASGFGFWVRYLAYLIAPAVMQRMPEILTNPTVVKTFNLNFENRIAIGEQLETTVVKRGDRLEFTVYNLTRANVAARGFFDLKESKSLPRAPRAHGNSLWTKTQVEFEHVGEAGWCSIEHYPTFMRIAELDLLERIGLSRREAEDRPPIPRVALTFFPILPVYEGRLDIETVVSRMGETSMTYQFDFHKDDLLTTQAQLTVVTIGPDGRPMKIPEKVRDAFGQYA